MADLSCFTGSLRHSSPTLCIADARRRTVDEGADNDTIGRSDGEKRDLTPGKRVGSALVLASWGLFPSSLGHREAANVARCILCVSFCNKGDELTGCTIRLVVDAIDSSVTTSMKITTVGELREALKGYPDDWQVIFGCEELEFYRAKTRGPTLVQIEFNQSVSATSDGKIHVD